MKKYMMYLLPALLLAIPLSSAVVWTQRNNMHMGLRETKDNEFAALGDADAIKNLSYRFTVTDSVNIWRIDGKGNQLKAVYDPQGKTAQFGVYDSEESYQLQPVFEDSMKMNSFIDRTVSDVDSRWHMIGGVEAITYRLLHEKKQFDEKPDDTGISFRILSVLDERPLNISYDFTEPQATLQCDMQNDTGGDPYMNARMMGMYEEGCYMIPDKYGFFNINPMQFSIDFSLVNIEKNPGGIYKMEHGVVKKIVSLPLGSQDILRMTSTDKLLAVLTLEHTNELYIHTFDHSGKELGNKKLPVKLEDATELLLQFGKDQQLLAGYHQMFEKGIHVHVLEQRNQGLQQKDEITIPTELAESTDQKILQYEDGILYYLQAIYNNEGQIYIGAANKDKILYSSEVYGEYQEDEQLTPLDFYNQKVSAYEKLIAGFTFDRGRSLDTLELLEIR